MNSIHNSDCTANRVQTYKYNRTKLIEKAWWVNTLLHENIYLFCIQESLPYIVRKNPIRLGILSARQSIRQQTLAFDLSLKLQFVLGKSNLFYQSYLQQKSPPKRITGAKFSLQVQVTVISPGEDGMGVWSRRGYLDMGKNTYTI